MLAFRGAGGEPPRRLRSCGVSPVPLVPQESSILPLQSQSVVFFNHFKSNNLLEKSLSKNRDSQILFLELFLDSLHTLHNNKSESTTIRKDEIRLALNHDDYIRQLFGNEDTALQAVNESIRKHGMPAISVQPEIGRLLALLVSIAKPRNVMEIGALGGYSGIMLAGALDKEGSLTSLELEETYANVAKDNVTKAGLGDKVKYVIGPALQNMESLHSAGQQYDFFFIDADKVNYPNYFDMSLKLASPGAVIVADNTLQGDRVMDDNEKDPNVEAIRTFNEKMATDERIEAIMLPLCDGLTVGRVKT